MKKIKLIPLLIIASTLTIIGFTIADVEIGKAMGNTFFEYILTMVKILPLTFILIALIEVWVEREKVEKHLGEGGGPVSYLWAILLGGITIGPMIAALPVSAALFRKGARLSVIFTYVGAATVCRIPMTLFEASYLGVKFTIIRYAVSLPLIIISSIIMGKALKGSNYEISE